MSKSISDIFKQSSTASLKPNSPSGYKIVQKKVSGVVTPASRSGITRPKSSVTDNNQKEQQLVLAILNSSDYRKKERYCRQPPKIKSTERRKYDDTNNEKKAWSNSKSSGVWPMSLTSIIQIKNIWHLTYQ
jgi:hypothetical protein